MRIGTTEPSAVGEEPSALAEAFDLQDRFVRGFPALRKAAGMTQRQVAAAAGWQQPYVDRLEDPGSSLIAAMARVERYAQACGFTTVIAFVERESGAVARTLPLASAGLAVADSLLVDGSSGMSSVPRDDDDPMTWRVAEPVPG